jgi:hypothetical protein
MQQQIARETKRDSSAMKSISLLTMVFLPAAAIAVSPPLMSACLSLFPAVLSTHSSPANIALRENQISPDGYPTLPHPRIRGIPPEGVLGIFGFLGHSRAHHSSCNCRVVALAE